MDKFKLTLSAQTFRIDSNLTLFNIALDWKVLSLNFCNYPQSLIIVHVLGLLNKICYHSLKHLEQVKIYLTCTQSSRILKHAF